MSHANLNHVAVYFDLSASSYLAVVRVLDLAQRTGATLSFRPVSTALFNKLTDAPPPPVFKGNKAARLKDDFDRYAARWNLVLKESVPPCDRALRVLHAAPDDASRGKLAIAMLQALHLGTADLEDIETLKRMSFGIVSAPEDVANAVQEDSVAAGNLQRTTEEYATHMGGLSLPGFWVPNPDLPTGQHGVGFADGGEIHMGHDRLHFVETRLKCNANPSSLPVPMPRIAAGPLKRHQTLNFWFDFSSPWTYLGYTQLRRLAAEAGDYLTINLKPTLLGIVFKEIGTPVVPTAVATKARQAWQQVELQRWASYWSEKPFKGSEPVPFKWSEHFPLRTPLALRMVCAAIAQKWSAEEVMKLSDTIFRACWADNIPIADKPPGSKPLIDYLTRHGYDGPKLASESFGNSKEADALLRKNTADAVASGICGFPTFQIGQDLVWGQDRLDVAADLLFGWEWRDEKAISRPKL